MRMFVTRASTLAVIVSCVVIAGVSSAAAALPVTPDLAWGTNGKVDVVLRAGNTIYLGGNFSSLQDPNSSQTKAVSNLAGIDATTGLPTSFAPAVNGEVFGLAQSPDGSRLYAVGNFTTVGGKTQRRIAAFDTSTGALNAWKPFGWPSNVVRAVAVTSDHVYIGGSFTTIGSTPAVRIASLSPVDGTASAGFTASADDIVRDIVPAAGRLYIAGNFSNVNGTVQGKLTAIDPLSGGSIAGVYHPSYPVLDIAAGTRLYGGGGGGGGKAFAVNLATGAKIWEIKTDGNVQAVDELNDTPYFGGHFLKYNGTAVGQLVRANPATGALDSSWLPQVTAGFLGVFAIDGFSPNKLYIGGDFTRVQGIKRTNFAQFTDGAAPASADVSVTLTGVPAGATLGQNVTYTAQIGNAGPDTALNTTVTDVLPATLDYVSAPGCTFASGTRTVTCNLGSVSTAGTSVTITATPNAAGSITNTVSATASTADVNPANNSATLTTPVASAGGADLGVTTSVAATVVKSTPFAIVLTITNHGPNASTATLVDTQPANAAANGAATTTMGSCSGSGVVTCALGSMASGDTATVTIPLTAPDSAQTLFNTASVSGTEVDPLSADDTSTTSVSVTDSGSSDVTPPALTGLRMLDQDHDGFVDTVTVSFNEPLATCAAPCTAGWTVANVPGGGSLQSVSTAGSTATLKLTGWTDQPDTAVGLFTIALSTSSGIQDNAGNHPSFAATAPADGAGPVPVGFRHQHNSGGACAGLSNVGGLAEPCDELTSEWSEQLLRASIPSATQYRITDPVGAGNQTVTIPGFLSGSMNLGSAGYLTLDDSSATWSSSLLVLNSSGDALTARIFGACTGTGCSALAVVHNVTVTYVPAATITDAAGNPAGGSFVKTQTMY